MRLVSVLTAAATLAAAAVPLALSPALAADYPLLRGSQIDTAPPSPVNGSGIDWSGFYFGGHGSYSSTRFNTANRFDNDTTAVYALTAAVGASGAGFNAASISQAYPAPRNADSRIGFGALAGYNMMIGDVVVGAEVDYSVHDQSLSRTTSSIIDNGFARTSLTSIQSVKLNDYGSIRLRAGWAVGNFLPFATAGIAIGRFNTNFTARGDIETNIGGVYTSNPGFPLNFGKAEKNAWGFGGTLGAGVDYALTENFLVRGEYLYTTFNKVNGVDSTLHTARVAGAVKF